MNINLSGKISVWCLFLALFIFAGCMTAMRAEKIGGKSRPEMTSDDAEALEADAMGFGAEKKATMKEARRLSERERGRSKPVASGLKAGYADDNKQYGFFLDFLKKYQDAVSHAVVNRSMDVGERILIKVTDKGGKSVPNARVDIRAGGKGIISGKTFADGSFLFFPSLYNKGLSSYDVTINSPGQKQEQTIKRDGIRQIDFQLESLRQLPATIPLDIVFVLDTTGSMGEEIARLKQTIELINMNLTAVSPTPDIRFGMVLYKDRGDSYRTNIVPFTADLNLFQTELNKVTAGGGGDTPEDLEAALDDTLNRLQWREDGIRLGFMITDAPPKIYQDQKFSYKDAAILAKQKAVKLFSVGTGGLPITGEYPLRQISQLTSAAYIFLTFGEKGESAGGKAGSVSHHTGSNFQTDKLEAIIIRFAKTELRHLSDKPLEVKDEFFQAVSIPDEAKEETLKQIFDKAAIQLVEYASFEVLSQTPTAVLPIVADGDNKANAELFTEQMGLALNGNDHFKSVARKDEMQSAEDELALGLSGMVDESNAAEVGNFIGASMLITGKLYAGKENYTIFFKLIRVETAEILSVTKLIIDKKLGI